MGEFVGLDVWAHFARMLGEGDDARLALFVAEGGEIPPAERMGLNDGLLVHFAAPAAHRLRNELVAGDALGLLQNWEERELPDIAAEAPGASRLLGTRNHKGVRSFLIATSAPDALMEALQKGPHPLGEAPRIERVDPWTAFAEFEPSFSEIVESQMFWPVIENLRSEGDELTAPRQIDLYFYPGRFVVGTAPPNLPGLVAQCETLGLPTEPHEQEGVRISMLAALTPNEIRRLSDLTSDWIHRFNVAFDGWEADLVANRRAG